MAEVFGVVARLRSLKEMVEEGVPRWLNSQQPKPPSVVVLSQEKRNKVERESEGIDG